MEEQKCKDRCRIKGKVNVDEGIIRERIEKALTEFDEKIRKTEILEIDAYLEKGDPISGKDFTAEEDGFKIINHALECAYFVPLSKIIKSSRDEIKAIVIALVDGIFQRVEGVTRIVGYYSRVNNWNKSKIGELRDRRIGNYWKQKRTNTEQVELLGEQTQ